MPKNESATITSLFAEQAAGMEFIDENGGGPGVGRRKGRRSVRPNAPEA